MFVDCCARKSPCKAKILIMMRAAQAMRLRRLEKRVGPESEIAYIVIGCHKFFNGSCAFSVTFAGLGRYWTCSRLSSARIKTQADCTVDLQHADCDILTVKPAACLTLCQEKPISTKTCEKCCFKAVAPGEVPDFLT